MESQNSVKKIWSTFSSSIQQSLLSLNIPKGFRTSSPFLSLVSSTPDVAQQRAKSSFRTLHEWYNTTTGLYATTGWWNAANILTTIANLAILNPSLTPQISSILQNSLTRAPQFSCLFQGSNYVKTINFENMLVETSWSQALTIGVERREVEGSGNGFLNDFYDDEGWWALAWIQAYDLTSNPSYLLTAASIFADMQLGESTPCGGGIWWSKSKTYVNAIANKLYLSVAVHLSNRAPANSSERDEYLMIAFRQWLWFENSGMINQQGTINDGLRILEHGSCVNNGGTVWSYNQGVIIAALVELSIATGNRTYLETAQKIAVAAIKRLARGWDSVLHDVCEGSGCGADGVQFKGVFLRGLMRLMGELGRDQRREFEEWVRVNVESVWRWDRDGEGRMGVVWSGPVREVSAGSHGSALDALVAGLFVDVEGE